jgi:APA family basic amino acid/polyamine antiporter
MALRIKGPGRPQPSTVPFVWVTAPLGILPCGFVMLGLPYQAWERFGLWIVVGLAIYVLYSYRHSKLRQARA